MHLAFGKEEICKFRRLPFLKYLTYPKEAAVYIKSRFLAFFLLIFTSFPLQNQSCHSKDVLIPLRLLLEKNNYKSAKHHKKLNLTILFLYFTNSGLNFKTLWDYL